MIYSMTATKKTNGKGRVAKSGSQSNKLLREILAELKKLSATVR